ncbi:B12-binding domain-containing radical SAM protein, partial [Sulfolobus sp. E3]
MKALLIRPTNPTGSGYNKSFGFMPTPLGLLQLAGDLRATGNWDVKVIDMEADLTSVDDVVNLAISYDPDIIGITLHATASHNVSVKIANGIKKELKDVILIAGGHHATFLPTQMLKDGFDIVVLGEGDLTIMEIGNAMKNRDFSNVRGIVYKEGEKIIRTPPAPLIEDLDKLPLPAFDLVEKERYRIDAFGENQYVACVETARGCPYACDFCSVTPTWGNKWRNKSNPRILKEIEEIKKLGYNWVFFVDDIFIVWPNRSQRAKLFREMIERKLTINFITQMRADVTARNPELIKLASEAGLRVAFLG